MPRHKEADRDIVMRETRERLLAAAAEEFAQKGYVGANINRISQAAGFAKGTIYNYFPSKRELMLALIDEIGAAHIAFIMGRVEREEEPGRRLGRFFEAGFAYVAGHPAPMRVMVSTLYGPDTEFKMRLSQAYRPLLQFVAKDIIAGGVARGSFRQVDPGATANLLMTIYLGAGSSVDEAGRPWLDPQQVADFVWHALRQEGLTDDEEG